MSMDTVKKAIENIRAAKMVILVDDEDRENEGDLCIAAEKVSAESINFMATHGRGLICLTLNDDSIRQLDLPMMVENNTSPFGTAFTISIEAREGVTTGISAADRAQTILTAVKPDATPQDIVSPGHVFPLRARPGGVLVRTGQTEGMVDLARLAGLRPAGVICEIMKDDGTMARRPDLEIFAEKHDLLIVTIADLIEYRLTHDSLVECLETQRLQHPKWGIVTVHVYGTSLDDRQHLVMVKGELSNGQTPLVRVQASYRQPALAGEVLDGVSGARARVDAAQIQLAEDGHGVLVCLDRGPQQRSLADRVSGLIDDDETSAVENPHEQMPPSILREIGVGAQILRDLGLHKIRLLTDNPKRLAGIEGYGLQIEDVISLKL